MFLGHYAVALGAKRLSPKVSLGTSVLAAQLLDGIWPVLLLLGIERVRIVPGLMAASPLDFEHYPVSHSLLAALAWAGLAAVGYFVMRRSRAGALVVGALVASHWFLDAPMHRPDLPLWPGSETLVGGGLWNSVPASVAVEVALLGIGLVVYLRATRPLDRIGSWGLGAMVGLLVFFYVGSLLGPPPPSETVLAVSALGLWLFVPWGYWVDGHRAARVDRPTGTSGAPSGAPNGAPAPRSPTPAG